EQTRWAESEDGRESFMKVKGARDLPPRGLAILRELYDWREGVARELDRATFRVLGNQALLEMSAQPPASQRALPQVSGISEGLAQRRGREIYAAVQRGLAVPEDRLPRWPRSPRFERDLELERRVESLKHARNLRAEALDMDGGFLLSRAPLEGVAKGQP